ncbi:MAG: hypothetical protein MJZ74_00150 [Muribaculaceae bacterium]|nr:hypothetical protein [Muribaculaceae bacterium]
MKHLIFTISILLLTDFAAKAQEQLEDYQPLVREGVEWVNYYQEESALPEYVCTFLYSYEFRGDSVCNGLTYKKCYLNITPDFKKIAEQSNYFSFDTSVPVALFREDEMKVYVKYEIEFVPGLQLMTLKFNENGEVLLYDFAKFREYDSKGLIKADFVNVDGTPCKRYLDVSDISETIISDPVIESIGAVGMGTLLYPTFFTIYSTDWHVNSGLAKVCDVSGKMIYYPENYIISNYDINRDLTIDVSDLDIVVDATNGIKLIDNMKEAADVNHDGDVDVSDINKEIDKIINNRSLHP